MIKINLLPKGEVRKEKNRITFVLLGVLLVFCAGILGGLYWYYNSSIEQTKIRIADVEKKIRSLEEVERQFNMLKAAKADIEKKLATINNLKQGRALSARILYDLSSLVSENLWIRNFKKSENGFEFEAFSSENDSISNIVEDLHKVPYIRGVELKKVEDVTEEGILVKKFLIQGTTGL